MYYLQSRYYNPEWGRFINADGIFESGHELLGNNLYAYCGNNPINNIDPDGNFIILISISALVAVVVKAIAITAIVTVVTAVAVGTGYLIANAISSNNNTSNNNNNNKNTNTKVSSDNKTEIKSKKTKTPAPIPTPPTIKYPTDVEKPPAPGFEWRGKGTPIDGKGNWFNPKTGESLRPDLNHPKPIPPHWDYQPGRQQPGYRWFPDGSMQAK